MNFWRFWPVNRAITAVRQCSGTALITAALAQASRGLRCAITIATWGDYQDLLPEHPSLWCYRRQWQGQTLVVVANLSREFQRWQPEAMSGEWGMLMSNYAEAANRPAAMTLRPFEAVWWLQE